MDSSEIRMRRKKRKKEVTMSKTKEFGDTIGQLTENYKKNRNMICGGTKFPATTVLHNQWMRSGLNNQCIILDWDTGVLKESRQIWDNYNLAENFDVFKSAKITTK